MIMNPMNTPSSLPIDPSGNYFNNIYANLPALGTNTNDAVLTFFETLTGGKESAALLATSVIYTALSQKTDPMALIQKFQEMPMGELNATLSAFLNLNRVNTSLLGVKNQPRTGYFVQRSILA